MEPGLVGREDDAATAAQVAATAGRYGARPRRPGRHLLSNRASASSSGPLWSPASSAGKTYRSGSSACRSVPPLWSPASSAGKTPSWARGWSSTRAAMEPGLVGREDIGDRARVAAGVLAAMEPGLVGREDVGLDRLDDDALAGAAMEPGLVGREDVVGVMPSGAMPYSPLWSPASSAGKTMNRGSDVRRGRCRYGARPRRPGRRSTSPAPPRTLWPLWSPASSAGKTRDAARGAGRGVAAAMEPGLVGREDAAASSAATATPPCRYGARPRRPGRQLARIIGADLWICRGLRAVVCSCSTLVGKLVGWFAESWPDRAASARQVWLVDLSARIR